VQTRSYEPADAENVAALFNAIDVAVGRPAVLTASLIDDFAGGLVASTATDSRLVTTDDGDVVAAGFVTTPPEGGYRLDLAGGVLPVARGQGIGRALLDWQVNRAEQIHATTAPDSRWEAHADVAELDTSALALLARSGFTPVRYSFDMVASTANVPDLQAPDGVTIAPYSADQAEAVHEAHMEAFAQNWGYQYRPFETWSAMTLFAGSFNPDLTVVAMAGAEIAGYTLAYNDAIADQVYLGQVGVRGPWRRQGLAAAMLVRVLRRAAEVGRGTAALDVDAASSTGAIGVYERVGFHTRHTVVTCARPLR
jgi:GNAT superfamily N-acetyltransferase